MASKENELEELFHLASSQPPENRSAFLEEHCSDPTLREQVLRLLAQDDDGTATLLREGARPEAAGERIDRYTLVRKLGEGGMGTVYLAHQEEPVRRDVALKTIRAGGHTEDVVRRFEGEKQALALMSHPGIAKVFDGGRTELGLPYFVMEYVPGESLSEYTARRRLEKRVFLELFCAICDAVQHAHHKGIVHRDLKPGNVLIVERGGRAHPKIIDFGIARSVSGSLTGDDALTRGQVVGTAKYLSPEQADPKKDIDTRADIYALGVVLYEWLAGEPPFSLGELEGRSPGEAWRTLLEEDPPPPSRRFAGLPAERRRAIADHRRSTPAEWERALAGDLDWIVMRALAKEREERYESASELRADIQRHLEDLPVSAGPPSGAYRARKFLRRHRIGVGSGVVVALSLLGGLGFSLWSLERVSLEGDRTRRELAESRYQTEKAEAFNESFADALGHGEPGRELPIDERLLRSSDRASVLFRGRPEAEAAVRFTLGEGFLLLGEDLRALEEFREAYRLQESVLDTEPEHYDLMRTLMRLVESARRAGHEEESKGYVRESLEKSRRILEATPELRGELECLFRASAGEEQARERELRALRTVLASFPEWRTAESKAFSRLVVEAVLNGSTGTDGVEELRALFASRYPPGSARELVLDWQIAQLYLQPRHLAPGESLRIARDVEERASSTFSPDHWLALDALRLRGLALAERWKVTRATSDLVQAEDLLHAACDRVAAIRGHRSHRQLQTALAFRALWEQLGDEGSRRAWLEASWTGWAADPRPRGWWPCSRPSLPDDARELALEVLPAGPDPVADVQRGHALAHLGLHERALAVLDPYRADATPLVTALRALCLAGLGRRSEASALRSTLGTRTDEGSEVERLVAEIDTFLGKE